ncbi:MAG: CPBP family intramembrane glutamic endopeptidase [Bacillota bacterium]
MMKQSFSERRPLLAAIAAALVCTLFTAVGTAVATITEQEGAAKYLLITPFLLLSVGLGVLYISRSRLTFTEYGFGRHALHGVSNAFFYLPLLLIELLPVAIYGFNPDLSSGLVLSLLLFTVAVGVNEELYFRGIALRLLRAGGIKRAIWLSSAIFGILHLANLMAGKDPLYALLQMGFAFLVGFVLAELVVVTERIWVPIFWHALHDFLAYTTKDVQDLGALLLLGAQVVILLVYAVMLWKKLPENPCNRSQTRL